MIVFDTNGLLRYFLRDNEEIADSVRERMNSERFIVPAEVIAEIVYVLRKNYSIDRKVIEEKVFELTQLDNIIIPRRSVVQEALRVYGDTNFDFVDCLMVGYARLEGYRVITYDMKLRKYLKSFWLDSEP